MPRIPRKLLVEPTEVAVFHCISRCVRRAFLCGSDRLTGKNFDHRKQWIQDRIAFLARHFGIDVLGFSVMSNHIHVVVRQRPDIVAGWAAEDVARRWWGLFPLRRDDDGSPAEPADWELSLVSANPERLAEVRSRLSSISWFMRCLAEPIARWANREDACTGRFWEGRYKCQPILDESALAACLAYVDLNPIRAGVAQTPETSEFTSVYERLGAQSRERADDEQRPQTEERTEAGGRGEREQAAERSLREIPPAACPLRAIGQGDVRPAAAAGGAAWLSPFELSAVSDCASVPPSRASNTGCLPMTFTQYLELLDWTGRHVRDDKRGSIPVELSPILERLHLKGDGWLDLVSRFSRKFRRAAGRPSSLRRHRDQWGYRRMPGISNSLAAFV